MKKKILVVISILITIAGYSQTLYVPGGSQNIGSSLNSNIGIGTNNPQEKLHVIGTSYFENDIYGKSFTLDLDAGSSSYPKRITSEAVGGSATMEFQTYSYNNSRLQTRILLRGSSGNDIEFYDEDENEYVHFDGETRNVGIGITSPSHKLDVAGTIHTQEIKVDMTGWSDFVFHPSYNLRPLQEVNTYIQQNGHLPEIPTAKEVEENGISLGEMNAKLLQKIEELTLYVIEQQRQIDELKKKVNE